MLAAVLPEIGHPVPAQGLAALRFWGQSGDRPDGWMAAADPVHFEARLDHLRLFALRGDAVSRPDLRVLFACLQHTLGDDEGNAFASIGRLGYLRGHAPIATAAVSAGVIDGYPPDDYAPGGDRAAAHDKLLGELQLALHDHEVNLQRVAAGERPVNSVWFWGGGTAPQQVRRSIPTLFADDPLFRGYWYSCTGAIENWTENTEKCLGIAPDGFVAVVPDQPADPQPSLMTDYLESLRHVCIRGDLRRLTMLFRDGMSIEIRTHDALRFWRKMSPLLLESASNE